MSRKDLIWVQVARNIKLEQEYKKEKAEWDFENNKTQHLCTIFADLQAILLDTNAFLRLIAAKGSKKKKIDLLDVSLLPSHIAQKEKEQKEYEERRAKMTEEERREEDIRNFKEGKKYRPRG